MWSKVLLTLSLKKYFVITHVDLIEINVSIFN